MERPVSPSLLPTSSPPLTLVPWQAEQVRDPGEVFQFLEQREIGQGLALYYAAYAAHLEVKHSFAKVRIGAKGVPLPPPSIIGSRRCNEWRQPLSSFPTSAWLSFPW